MKVLITGAAGFIGSNILKFLIDKKFEIYAIYNRTKPQKYKKVKYIKSDLKNLKKIPSRLDCIIHSAVKNPENTNKNILLKDNVITSKNIFNLAIKFKAKKIIYFSSIAVYENIDKPLIEEKDLKLEPLTTYAKSKYRGEILLKNITKNTDISTILIRLPTVIGPGSKFNSISIIKKKILSGKKISIFSPDSKYNRIIHIRALNNFIYKTIVSKNKINEVIHLGSSHPIKFKNLILLMFKILKIRPNIQLSKKNKSFLLNLKKAKTHNFFPETVKSTINYYLKY